MNELETYNHRARIDTILIVGLFALAAALRLFGNRYGLPWIYEPDPDSVVLAKSLSTGGVGVERLLKPTRYPHLMTYLLVPLMKLFPGANEMWIGRTLSGLLGAGCVVFTYLCGKQAAGRRAGVLAALMVCFSFLAVQHSHLAKPHVAVALFTTACLYYCMRIIEKPGLYNYILAGISGGLAVATLHSGFVAGACLLTAVALAPSRYGPFSVKRYLAKGPIIAVFIILLGIPLGHPNRIAGLIEIARGAQEWSYLMRPHVPSASESLGTGAMKRVPLTLLAYDPWVSILGTIALLSGLWKRPRWWKLCLPGLVMTLFFFLVFGHIKSFVPRFLILVLPPLSVAAAALVETAMSRLGPGIKRFAYPVAFVLFLLPGVAAVLKLDSLYVAEDTRVMASRWIEENVPVTTPLAATPYIDFPLSTSIESKADHQRVLMNLPRWEKDNMDEDGYRIHFPFKDRWSANRKQRLAYLQERGVGYGLSVFYRGWEYHDPGYNVFSKLGKTVFSALPGKEGVLGFDLYYIPNPLWLIWNVDRPGPLVVVVKL